MRVMVLTADFPPYNWSGIGVAVENQAQALASIGVEVHVLFPIQAGCAPTRRPGRGPILHNLTPDFCPVDPRRFDLVHLHSLALTEFALQLRRRFGIPIVYTVHSLLHLELEGLPQMDRWRAVQSALLRQSDWVVFLSQAEREAAVNLIPELADRSSVIPHGVSPPPDLRAPLPSGGPVVFAGRFTQSKGVKLLAGLVPEVLERSENRFVLAGGHGDEFGARLVRRLGASYPERCELKGWMSRDSLDALFAGAALVIVPSLYEPFGMVALEAMRVGAPVLASAVGSLNDIVGQDSGGCLVRSHRVGDWVQAILKLTSDPAARGAMRKRGPQYVARRFDRRRLAMRLREEVYAARLS